MTVQDGEVVKMRSWMARFLPALVLLLVVTACSKPVSPVRPPEPSGQAGESPMPRPSGLSGPEEAFVLETLRNIAAGEPVRRMVEQGETAQPLDTARGLFQSHYLARAALAWEAGGMGRAGAPSPTFDPYDRLYDLEVAARRYPFIAMDQARVLYLDRSLGPERYAALVQVQPLGAFLYMTFRADGESYAVTALVDTQPHSFRRAAEADLHILSLAQAQRWDELKRHLLVPWPYLAAYGPEQEQHRTLQGLLADRSLEWRALHGQLYLGEQRFNLDWVRMPDGSLKVASATVTPTGYTLPEQALPVAIGPLELSAAEAGLRETALTFIRRWGAGDAAGAETMLLDRQRFYALSELSRSGVDAFDYQGNYWRLKAEKARLDYGYDLAAPLDWTAATVAETGPGYATVAFPGTPLQVALFIPEPGRLSSLELSFAWDERWGNGRQEPFLERLPRLDDWRRAAALLAALDRGDLAAAASAAGLPEADLRHLLTEEANWSLPDPLPQQPADWQGRVGQIGPGPGAGQIAEAVQQGKGVQLTTERISAAFAFTGPADRRRLALVSFGPPEYPVELVQHQRRGAPLTPTGDAASNQAWLLPFPAGDRLLLASPPGEVLSPALQFVDRAHCAYTAPCTLTPPDPGAVWQPWLLWQPAEQPEWWVAYGSDAVGNLGRRLARIRWRDERPEIIATYPAPAWGDSGRFADLDGDGVPEYLSLAVAIDAGAARPTLVQWLRHGEWQARPYLADNQWSQAEADRLGQRIAWLTADGLVTVPYQTGAGPGEPVAIPRPPGRPLRFEATDGLIWWQQEEQLVWLAPGGLVSRPGQQVVQHGDLDGSGRHLVLVATGEPTGLALYTLDGAPLWSRPWPLVLSPGIHLDGEVVAVARHADDDRIARVQGWRVTAAGPELAWEGPDRFGRASVQFKAVDLDGTARQDLLLVTWGSKGYWGFQVYSDSETAWGGPSVLPK